MNKVKMSVIKEVCNSIIESDKNELYKKTQEELEYYWYFKFNNNISNECNLYEFIKMIELYKSYCIKWEEYHNDHVCIVERVREKYLMPKINAFLDKINNEQ